MFQQDYCFSDRGPALGNTEFPRDKGTCGGNQQFGEKVFSAVVHGSSLRTAGSATGLDIYKITVLTL